VEGQDIDVMVVDNIQSQSKFHLSKVFVDISGNSCIVFLCCVLADEQCPFWVIRGTIKWVSHRVRVAGSMSYKESRRFLNENNIS